MNTFSLTEESAGFEAKNETPKRYSVPYGYMIRVYIN